MRLACLFVALMAAWPSLAQAHFLWVVSQPGKDGANTVQVYFAEGADAGEVNLIDRVAHAKAWVRTVQTGAAASTPVEVKLVVKKEDAFGLLTASSGSARVDALEAACKFGVITRGEKTSLLQYYAKWLAASPKNFKALGRSESLPLDVVPHAGKAATEIEVLWQGKPAEGSQVVIDAAGKQTKHITDKAGRLSLATDAPGRYAIRARWAEDKSGQEGDKKYEQRLYYTTLVLDVPKAKAD